MTMRDISRRLDRLDSDGPENTDFALGRSTSRSGKNSANTMA
jgi:hypothetical protein